MKDMSAQRGKGLLIAGGVVALVVIAAAAALLLFDINSFKSHIETAVFDATGLEVRIKGEMAFSLFPFGLSARDIRCTNEGSEIISLESISLRAKLLPLLKKQLKVTSCAVVKPAVTIVKGADGKFNYESSAREAVKGRPGAVFSLKELKLSQGALVYLDRNTGEKTEFNDFNLTARDLSLAGNGMQDASFSGNFDCREIRKGGFRIDNVKSPVTAAKGVISLSPLTMDIFGAKGEGDATLDRSGSDPLYKINLQVAKLDFENLEQSYGIKKVMGGKGDLSAALTMGGKGSHQLMSSLGGTLSLRGDNLVVNDLDLDKALSSYKASQEFSLVDLGAFFIAGPLSNIAVRAYLTGDMYREFRGGQGTITHFNSHWKIKDGVAEATDCALATQHNRVALKGRLDLVNKRYENVIVALLDDQGCAKFDQTINGPFRKPRISAVNMAESLAGPFSALFRKAKRIVQGGTCKVIYNGSVKQPPQ